MKLSNKWPTRMMTSAAMALAGLPLGVAIGALQSVTPDAADLELLVSPDEAVSFTVS